MSKVGEKFSCPGCGVKFTVEEGQKTCTYCGFSLTGKTKPEGSKEIELGLCPFSWITQEKGCFIKTNVWEPVKCLGIRCQIWDVKTSACAFNNLSKK